MDIEKSSFIRNAALRILCAKVSNKEVDITEDDIVDSINVAFVLDTFLDNSISAEEENED